jgi:hypothetical protein
MYLAEAVENENGEQPRSRLARNEVIANPCRWHAFPPMAVPGRMDDLATLSSGMSATIAVKTRGMKAR